MGQTRASTQFEESGTPVRCQLAVIDGPDAGRAVILSQPVLVGSGSDANLKLNDDRVSARHAVVSPGNEIRLVDEGSTNGTWLDGLKVADVRLPVGATFRVGRTSVRLEPAAREWVVAPSAARRFGEMVAESLAMRELFAVLELAAAGDTTVLVTGETGTGKELVARALHERGPRRGAPFVTVDCGAIPESLIESELFGHVRGAFTGAVAERQGAFLRAHRGTLFLDELGHISASAQARLLRALETRHIKAVGADDERLIDVRVIAATPVDLASRVATGQFRADLFYRLSVIAVTVPALRQRREDIAPIVGELLVRRGLERGGISGPNLDRLLVQPWPGNVRELRNVIDRAVALSPGAQRFADLKLGLPHTMPASGGLTIDTSRPFKQVKEATIEAFEARYVSEVHDAHDGNVSAGARFAEVDRKHWRALLRKHGVLAGGDDE
jgi:DNA-binding NtrC family response regulator